MTLRKSIIISVALHFFLFGGGLAFARFSGLLSWGQREPIMVTLVGDGGISSRTGESGKKRAGDSAKTVQERPALQPELPSEKPSTIPDAANGSRDRLGDNDSEQRTGPANEQAAGSSSASVTSKQWTVIVSSIERVKSYPRLARERGIEGVVYLRFRLRSSGEIEWVEIVKSSGHEILDTASVSTVYRAVPLPYVSGWVEVPMAYVLK